MMIFNGDRPASERWVIATDGMGDVAVWDQQSVAGGPVFTPDRTLDRKAQVDACQDVINEMIQELLYKHADNSGDVIDE